MCNEKKEEKKLPPREIMFAVNRLSRIFHREMRKVCEENGVPSGYRSLLFHLAHNDGCSQRVLAGKTGLQPSTISIAIDKMERDGYVFREKSPEDLRSVRVYLTEKGKNIDRLNRERIALLDSRFSATVTAEEKEQLICLLEKVMDGYCRENGYSGTEHCPHNEEE